MSEMIERVARRLAWAAVDRGSRRDAGFFQRMYPNGLGQYVDENWQKYEGDAHAAIEAMREPTEAMENAAWSVEGATLAWEGMIDAALK